MKQIFREEYLLEAGPRGRVDKLNLSSQHNECQSVITSRPVAKIEELIARKPEELMQEAASDELFLADLNETMEDFGYADQEANEILTMDRLAG